MWRHAVLTLLAASICALCGCGGLSNPYAGEEGVVVLHTSVSQDSKGFDPVKASDVLSNRFICQIYECLYQHSYLERPYRVEPCLADGMPEISENKLTYTFRIKRGVHFADDPCFTEAGGKGRELTAEDFVYSWKRLADAKNDPEGYWLLQGYVKGLDEFFETSQDKSKKTDYSREVEGLKALDKYTLTVTLTKPFPRLLWVLCMSYTAAVAREAVEYYGEEFLNHPVGTGPFLLKRWDHWHKIVLERNPNFRDEFYPAKGESGDKELGLLNDAGKKLPLADRVVYTIIKQSQPAWLYFLSGYIDSSGIPKDSWNTAMRSLMELSPAMEEKGITLWRYRSYSVYYTSFNMNNPVVGLKYPEAVRNEIAQKRKAAKEVIAAAEKAAAEAEAANDAEKARTLREEAGKNAEELLKEADRLEKEMEKELPTLAERNEKRRKLRQAMSLAYNRPERIDIFANGRAEPAQGPIPPGFVGHDPNFKNPYSEFNLDKARKLLTEAGYPGGIGPDGKQLTLTYETTGTSTSTMQNADFFRQEMKKLGIRIEIQQNTWTEFQKKIRDGRAQIYYIGWIADYPDPENFLQLLYGPSRSPGPNNANYVNPDYDRLHEEMRDLSDIDPVESKRKYELCRKMEKIVTEDCPWIFGLYYYSYTLCHKWHKNYKPHAFAYNAMKYQTVDPQERLKLSREWNKPTMWPAYAVLVLLAAMAALFVYKVKQQSQ